MDSISQVISVLSLLIALCSLYFSWKAEKRADSAEKSARFLESRQSQHIDLQIIEKLKEQLKPLYGTSAFKNRLLAYYAEGMDVATLLKAMDQAVREKDENTSRASRRVTQYRVEILDRVFKRKQNEQ